VFEDDPREQRFTLTGAELLQRLVQRRIELGEALDRATITII
jgi:hypothetical protein